MKLEIKKGSENYCCTVVEIKKVFPIENADKIQLVSIFGNNVVCSIDIKVGDKMLYFNSGTKLNFDYCVKNNLLDKAELNKDVTKKGFISYKQLRIKAIKLRGVISDGIIMPLESLLPFCDIKNFKIGDEFNDINGNTLCEKYIVPVKNTNFSEKNPKQLKLQNLLIKDQFRFHHNTEHFAKNLHKFNDENNIVITRKMHGSSGIVSNVLVVKQLTLLEKICSWFIDFPKTEYGFIYSSGKPKSEIPKGIESSSNNWLTKQQSFYKEDIWKKSLNKLKDFTEKGITLYFEIVGTGIQGDSYTYGYDHEIFIYRITTTNQDGIILEFSWNQIKQYCNKYNLKYVEEYYQGEFGNCAIKLGINPSLWINENKLDLLSKEYLNKSYSDCKIDEGVCIRNETLNEIFKLKSSNFIKMESDNQDKNITNIEDNQ